MANYLSTHLYFHLLSTYGILGKTDRAEELLKKIGSGREGITKIIHNPRERAQKHALVILWKSLGPDKKFFVLVPYAPSLAPAGGIKRQGAPVKRSPGGVTPGRLD